MGGNTHSAIVSNQQYVFEQLLKIRNSRELVTVYTPYGKFFNLAIASIQMKQQGSNFQSSIEIRMQQWMNVSPLEARQATESEKAAIVELQKRKMQDNAYSGQERLQSNLFKMYKGLK